MNEKQQQAAIDRKNKLGKQAAKQLLKAAETLQKFRYACETAGEQLKGLDDTRVTLPAKMFEYGHYLDGKYGE